VPIERLKASKHRRRSVRIHPNPIDKIAARQVQTFFADRFRSMTEQRLGVAAQKFLYLAEIQ
jgi:hypothetical protein